MRGDSLHQISQSFRSMENSLMKLFFLFILCSCGASASLHSGELNVPQQRDTILVDRDGNRYPIKVLADGNLWMTANLKLITPNSYCYNNNSPNCDQYGRLYSWESADQACKILGEGWQLPGKNDWQELSNAYGGSLSDSMSNRKKAYESLMITGKSGFAAVLGGGRDLDGAFARLDAHGFYWMSSETDSTAGFANFAKGSKALFLQNDGEKSRAFSVRCIKQLNNIP